MLYYRQIETKGSIQKKMCYASQKKATAQADERKKRKMKNIMKVRQLINKNQFILENDETITFQSYDSIIAICNKKTGAFVLGADWNYSNTTRKHLYIFIDDELSYHDNLKELFQTRSAKNRRKAIQKLIDDEKIQYSEVLR